MPAFSGKFDYQDERGVPLVQSACQVSFEEENCTVTPVSGVPLSFDLGDVDRIDPGAWDFTLTLYTGRRICLHHFGPALDPLAQELTTAWRNRTVRCLLLEDLSEVARFQGTAGTQRAEIRLYKSNLAVLPVSGLPIQWRLAEVDGFSFDESTYNVTLCSGPRRLVIGKLAKKTEEFLDKLDATLQALRAHSSAVLHDIFPFLTADLLKRTLTVIPEGRSVRLSALAGIHPRLPEALLNHAIDEALRPYFDSLRARTPSDSLFAGFKFVRPGEEDPEEPAPGVFFWFFFPLNGRVAWEAVTGSGRATYFFRAGPETDAEVANLTRGLALVNFRREPVYLPDESLEHQPRFHRYAIGCRKLPDLRALRAAFLGRATHSSVEAWEAQVTALIAP